jgi:hypothetical protein
MGKLIQKSTEGAAREKQNPYLDLPSKEHRGHIRRFRGLTDLSDEEDVRSRGAQRFGVGGDTGGSAPTAWAVSREHRATHLDFARMNE